MPSGAGGTTGEAVRFGRTQNNPWFSPTASRSPGHRKDCPATEAGEGPLDTTLITFFVYVQKNSGGGSKLYSV